MQTNARAHGWLSINLSKEMLERTSHKDDYNAKSRPSRSWCASYYKADDKYCQVRLYAKDVCVWLQLIKLPVSQNHPAKMQINASTHGWLSINLSKEMLERTSHKDDYNAKSRPSRSWCASYYKADDKYCQVRLYAKDVCVWLQSHSLHLFGMPSSFRKKFWTTKSFGTTEFQSASSWSKRGFWEEPPELTESRTNVFEPERVDTLEWAARILGWFSIGFSSSGATSLLLASSLRSTLATDRSRHHWQL